MVSLNLSAQVVDDVLPRDLYRSSTIEPRAFDSDQWAKTIEGIDYSKSYRQDLDYDEDFSDSINGKKKKDKSAENLGGVSPFWNSFVKILFIILAIGLIAFILFAIYKGNLFHPRSKNFSAKHTHFDLETVEENIHESDLDQFIKEALNNQNYSLAIRLYYLAMIKELSINRLIKWKRDKTNRNYLRELKDGTLSKEFREATQIFERIWYGTGELQYGDFQHLQPRFQQWINNIKTTGVATNTPNLP